MALRIETRGLEKTYRQGRVSVPVLRGVDLQVERGEFVAVMGPSGCGKSTLLYLIAGLTRPTAGQVLIDDVDLAGLPDREVVRLRREKAGFVFQRFNLLPTLSAHWNLRLALAIRGGTPAAEPSPFQGDPQGTGGLRVSSLVRTGLRAGQGRPAPPGERELPADDRVRALLQRVGLDGKASFRPRALSMGEQQRVAIARAVVHAPAILLADEPTGNLDSAAADVVLDLLGELNRELGQTILMVTHNREVAARAHRIIHLRDGRVENTG